MSAYECRCDECRCDARLPAKLGTRMQMSSSLSPSLHARAHHGTLSPQVRACRCLPLSPPLGAQDRRIRQPHDGAQSRPRWREQLPNPSARRCSSRRHPCSSRHHPCSPLRPLPSPQVGYYPTPSICVEASWEKLNASKAWFWWLDSKPRCKAAVDSLSVSALGGASGSRRWQERKQCCYSWVDVAYVPTSECISWDMIASECP